MISNFKKFNEELKIKDVDESNLSTMKYNFINKLKEYKEYFLTNINYDPKTKKVEYKNFSRIDKNTILRELYNEFTKEFIQELNLESFIRKLNNIMRSKKSNTKKRIRGEFKTYINNIDKKIDIIRK